MELTGTVVQVWILNKGEDMKKYILIILIIILALYSQTAFADSPLTVYSSTSDGIVSVEGEDWDTVHDATEGTDTEYAAIYIAIGAYNFPGGYAACFRSFVFFDTSSIPSGAIIDSATLSLYGKNADIGDDYDIVVQNGQPTYPHDSLVGGDYLYTHYSGDGGSFNTSTFTTTGYNVITLNATGRGWINKSGKTKLALLSSPDIDDNCPENSARSVWCWSADETEGGELRPKLIVNYHVAADNAIFWSNF